LFNKYRKFHSISASYRASRSKEPKPSNCCFSRGKATNYSQARTIYSLVMKSVQTHKKYSNIADLFV